MALRSKIAILIALALGLGSIAYTLISPGGESKVAKLDAELRKIQAHNQKLSQNNRRLVLEVDALKRRKDYLERIAREELGLIRKDEVVLQLPAPARPPKMAKKQKNGQRVKDQN